MPAKMTADTVEMVANRIGISSAAIEVSPTPTCLLDFLDWISTFVRTTKRGQTDTSEE